MWSAVGEINLEGKGKTEWIDDYSNHGIVQDRRRYRWISSEKIGLPAANFVRDKIYSAGIRSN